MAGYIGNSPAPGGDRINYVITATAGQDIFPTDGYTPGYTDVYLNGRKLVDGTQVSTINGSTVFLTSPASAGDVLEVVSYAAYEIVDAETFNDGLTISNTNDTVLKLDRRNSDGNVLVIQSRGNRVGRIGIYNNNFGVIGPDNGFLLATGAAIGGDPRGIIPCNTNGTPISGAVDLGEPNASFRKLYLSEGAYIGGTGPENHLNRYMSGSITPTVSWIDQLTAPNITSSFGEYTYVGNLVIVRIIVAGDFGTGQPGFSGPDSTTLKISGLPLPNRDESIYFLNPRSSITNADDPFFKVRLLDNSSDITIYSRDNPDSNFPGSSFLDYLNTDGISGYITYLAAD